MVNIVGDKSTGKTLLAIEACANFAKQHPDGDIFYCEVEAAFSPEYAEGLGFPVSRVTFIEECRTVEDLFEDLQKKLEKCSKPTLYIVDSLDALSDRAEQEREIDKGTFGANKAKIVGQLFRRLVALMEEKNLTLFIISQERDNIGVMFGKTTTRSGGRALDFYASQIIWLSQIKTHKKTRKGIERTIGIQIKAKCEKNKVGPAYRICEFPIIFGFGVDDVKAGLDFLIITKSTDKVDLTQEEAKALTGSLDDYEPADLTALRESVLKAVVATWREIEADFAPTRKKYP